MNPLFLHLSDPAVTAVMNDFTTVQRREVLRRGQRAMSAIEFADACSMHQHEADACRVRVEDAGPDRSAP